MMIKMSKVKEAMLEQDITVGMCPNCNQPVIWGDLNRKINKCDNCGTEHEMYNKNSIEGLKILSFCLTNSK